MGLMEREYMSPDYKPRKTVQGERKKRQDEIFRIYQKKHLTIFDKMKIKRLEKENRDSYK